MKRLILYICICPLVAFSYPLSDSYTSPLIPLPNGGHYQLLGQFVLNPNHLEGGEFAACYVRSQVGFTEGNEFALAQAWTKLPTNRDAYSKAVASAHYKVEFTSSGASINIPFSIEWVLHTDRAAAQAGEVGPALTKASAYVRIRAEDPTTGLNTNTYHQLTGGPGHYTLKGSDQFILPSTNSFFWITLNASAECNDNGPGYDWNYANAYADPVITVDPSYEHADDITLVYTASDVIAQPVVFNPGNTSITEPFLDVSLPDTIGISWSSISGMVYQVQYSTNLLSANWFDLGDSLIGDGMTNSIVDTPVTNSARYYRVLHNFF